MPNTVLHRGNKEEGKDPWSYVVYLLVRERRNQDDVGEQYTLGRKQSIRTSSDVEKGL